MNNLFNCCVSVEENQEKKENRMKGKTTEKAILRNNKH